MRIGITYLNQVMNTAKILVTGLPRTGTTSVCIAALHLGVKTAHTAYTREALGQAQLSLTHLFFVIIKTSLAYTRAVNYCIYHDHLNYGSPLLSA